jgi:hypothetical protein
MVPRSLLKPGTKPAFELFAVESPEKLPDGTAPIWIDDFGTVHAEPGLALWRVDLATGARGATDTQARNRAEVK